jgi:O-antigen ligase
MTAAAIDVHTDLRSLGIEPQGLPFTTLWVGPFIMAAVTIAALDPWNWFVKGFGVILAFAYLAYAVRHRVLPNAEMILFILWLTWALVGVFTAVSGQLFWWEWSRDFQIWVMLCIISGLTFSRRLLYYNLAWFLAGVAVVGAYSFATGDYSRAVTGGEGERVAGLTLNANQFGWVMLLATVAMAYVWMSPSRSHTLKYVILAVGMGLAAVASILSGSRKALLGLGLFYMGWMWFCYRREILKRPGVLAGVAVLAIGAVAVVIFARHMPVAQRFLESWQALTGERIGGGGLNRLDLYHEAWRIFVAHPVMGVGMDQYRVHSIYHDVAHSEYAEIAADTGLVGFVLYFGIFAAMWWRAGKIRRSITDPFVVRVAGLVRAMLIVILVLDLGRYNYGDKPVWIILASFTGYLSAVWQNWRASQASPAAAPGPHVPAPVRTG